jgi:hypothetical protein
VDVLDDQHEGLRGASCSGTGTARRAPARRPLGLPRRAREEALGHLEPQEASQQRRDLGHAAILEDPCSSARNQATAWAPSGASASWKRARSSAVSSARGAGASAGRIARGAAARTMHSPAVDLRASHSSTSRLLPNPSAPMIVTA